MTFFLASIVARTLLLTLLINSLSVGADVGVRTRVEPIANFISEIKARSGAGLGVIELV